MTRSSGHQLPRAWPQTVMVRMCFGCTVYYRRFVKCYASERPLDQEGNPSLSHQSLFGEGFQIIIERLTNPLVLAYADYRLPFKLHTDAASTGMRAVLYQEQDGDDRDIACSSISLTPAG